MLNDRPNAGSGARRLRRWRQRDGFYSGADADPAHAGAGALGDHSSSRRLAPASRNSYEESKACVLFQIVGFSGRFEILCI